PGVSNTRPGVLITHPGVSNTRPGVSNTHPVRQAGVAISLALQRADLARGKWQSKVTLNPKP
ncbi:hypothetical protein T484DRAFT_1647231, partial [Baffinella frigidus]